MSYERPIRPSRDRTHTDRKREQAKTGRTTWDEIVDETLDWFEARGHTVKYPKPKQPEFPETKTWPVICPDCGVMGTDHQPCCIHRR